MSQPTNEQIDKFMSDEINKLTKVSDDNLLAISHNLISVSKQNLTRDEMDQKVKEQLVHFFKEILLASTTLNSHVQLKIKDRTWSE